MPTLLLQDPYSLFGGLAGTLLGLVAIAIVGYLVVMKLRRSIREGEESSTAFTLEDLRRLRRDGRITEEEYERARSMMIERAKSVASRSAADAAIERGADATARGTSRTRTGQASILRDPAVEAELERLRAKSAREAEVPASPPPPSTQRFGAGERRKATEIRILPEVPDSDPGESKRS